MKIKIIELLNRIANGEEVPKKIEYKYFEGDSFENLIENLNYFHYKDFSKTLNDEVEIIEEDKTIEELQFDSEEKYITTITGTTNKMRNIDVTLATKINELVKEIKKMKEN